MKREERICCCREDVETERHLCGLYHEVWTKYDVDVGVTVENLLSGDNYVDYIQECVDVRKKHV